MIARMRRGKQRQVEHVCAVRIGRVEPRSLTKRNTPQTRRKEITGRRTTGPGVARCRRADMRNSLAIVMQRHDEMVEVVLHFTPHRIVFRLQQDAPP